MSDGTAAGSAAAPPAPSDPYVIYQLRKPSQRGTAVIPRFVPNTHAPAFSPANYRFARVWTASADPAHLSAAPADPSALLHVPRSFEYAASLGSESSFWSDGTASSSWVSVSSLRTANTGPSDHRHALLHAKPSPVSAAAFFTDDFHPRPAQSPSSKPNRSGLEKPNHYHVDKPRTPASPFRYPPALAQSVSEDALLDDLLSHPAPQYPNLRSNSNDTRITASPTTANPQTRTRRAPDHHLAAHTRPSSAHRRAPDLPRHISSQTRRRPAGVLPSLTRKRRSLWQWLFCADGPPGSTTAASIEAPPQHPPSAHRKSSVVQAAKAKAVAVKGDKDRVAGGDRDFLRRVGKTPDAPRRRAPSFEIRRGRPDREKAPRRSLSWNMLSNAIMNRDGKKKKKPAPPSTQPPQFQQQQPIPSAKKKKKQKQKDRPRGIVVEEEPRANVGSHHLRFQRSGSSGKGGGTSSHAQSKKRDEMGREKERERDGGRKSRHPPEVTTTGEHHSQNRPREDRPREDRPRQAGQGQMKESAPVQKSVVPSLREKKGGKGTVHTQRMRSIESADPVTSRISSDLSSAMERSTGSGASTPVHLQQFRTDGQEMDPAANGVSSDVSSHVSGGQGKSSPVEQNKAHESVEERTRFAPPIDLDSSGTQSASRDPAFRPNLFAFPGSSKESSSHPGTYQQDLSQTENKMPINQTSKLSEITDPVARALEKNRARSAGGPLSYLMRNQDEENDVDTQSTGLTSLADESVSTHKTVSGVDDYRAVPGYGSSSRYRYHDSKKTARHLPEMPDDISDGSGAGRPVIFKSSRLFNPAGAMSPGRVSSSASPRRFHSDWSDPHATDIDVYCQCKCSCVYEEECRRTCELLFGRRSPSVSSSRSCSRYGYPGFQTLPPAMDSEMRFGNLSPNVIESPGEPCAFIAMRGDIGRMGVDSREKNAESSYMRAAALDEMPDLRASGSGQTANHTYILNRTENHTYDARPRNGNYEESTSKNSSSQSKRYRSEEYQEERRREEPRERRTSHGDQGSRGDRPRSHRDSSKSRRRPDSSSRRRSSSRDDGSTNSREHGSRRSSRNTTGSGSSRHSSGLPKMPEAPRDGRNRDVSGEVAVERRRRDEEERKRYPRVSASGGPQQMGNNYVVKRNGPPPFNQAQMPEPYRASGYGREVSYDYDDKQGHSSGLLGSREWPLGDNSSPVGYGPPPVVELEYETGPMGSSPDPHRSRGTSRNSNGHRGNGNNVASGRKHRKEEIGEQGSRQMYGNHRSKGESRPPTKHAKVTSRQSSKSSSRSRTPMFSVF